MKWLQRCCCCCSCWSKEESSTLNDNSSLIHRKSSSSENESQAFVIPRRHSSFHSTTYDTVSNTPAGKCQSDSFSSSDEENGTRMEQRGRSWSTIPSTSEDVNHRKIVNQKKRSSSFSTVSSKEIAEETNNTSSKDYLSFDKHILTEIAESEATGEEGGTGEEESPRTPKMPDAADIYGYLTFVTTYDEEQLRLNVFVEKASGLPKKKPQESYNTFVKTSIIYSNKNSLMTRTVKNTLSPIYKEDHVFHTNKAKWTSTNQTTLRLSLIDCDRQGRHDAVGHALLPLSLLSSKEETHVLPLTPMSVPVRSLGQVLVGLSYVPTQSLLSVQVLKARHLRLDPDIHKRHFRPITKEALDTFAKVTLMCAGQKVKSNACRVIFGAKDPFYNFKNSFVLPPQFMLDASVIVTIIVRSMLGRSFTLGRMISGPYTELSDTSLTHWGKMVQENRNIVQWRNLYL